MRKKRSGGLHAWITSKPRVKKTRHVRRKVIAMAAPYSSA
jgi:hypothetical protein